MFDLNVCYTWFVSRILFSLVSFHFILSFIKIGLAARVCVFAPVKWINYAHIEISVRIADLNRLFAIQKYIYILCVLHIDMKGKKVSTMLASFSKYRDFVWFCVICSPRSLALWSICVGCWCGVVSAIATNDKYRKRSREKESSHKGATIDSKWNTTIVIFIIITITIT